MQLNFDIGFAERLKTAAAARQAKLAGFKPRPARLAPNPIDGAADRAAELERVRQDRAEAKAAKRDAAAEAVAAQARAEEEQEAAALEAKRGVSTIVGRPRLADDALRRISQWVRAAERTRPVWPGGPRDAAG